MRFLKNSSKPQGALVPIHMVRRPRSAIFNRNYSALGTMTFLEIDPLIAAPPWDLENKKANPSN